MELTNPLFLFSLSGKLLSSKRLENPGNLCLSTQGSWFKEDLQAAGELEATPSLAAVYLPGLPILPRNKFPLLSHMPVKFLLFLFLK